MNRTRLDFVAAVGAGRWALRKPRSLSAPAILPREPVSTAGRNAR